jgi:hypothetical protein
VVGGEVATTLILARFNPIQVYYPPVSIETGKNGVVLFSVFYVIEFPYSVQFNAEKANHL